MSIAMAARIFWLAMYYGCGMGKGFNYACVLLGQTPWGDAIRKMSEAYRSSRSYKLWPLLEESGLRNRLYQECEILAIKEVEKEDRLSEYICGVAHGEISCFADRLDDFYLQLADMLESNYSIDVKQISRWFFRCLGLEVDDEREAKLLAEFDILPHDDLIDFLKKVNLFFEWEINLLDCAGDLGNRRAECLRMLVAQSRAIILPRNSGVVRQPENPRKSVNGLLGL